MLSQVEQAKQKWGGAHQAIDTWLHERQELLVKYCELAGLPPFKRSDGALPNSEDIRSFCELLVDYVSAGHFEVYDKIAMQCDKSEANIKLTDTIYPRISETTEDALMFNDLYAEVDSDQELNGFDQKLANLGQRLEERFALEDELIHTLHQKQS